MTKRMHGLWAMVLVVWAGTARAGDWPDYAEAASDKLLRGVANAGYGWLEIPKNLVNETSRRGYLFLPLGLAKGLGYMVGRSLAGVADVASFPVPGSPLVRPALVWHDTETETVFTWGGP